MPNMGCNTHLAGMCEITMPHNWQHLLSHMSGGMTTIALVHITGNTANGLTICSSQ